MNTIHFGTYQADVEYAEGSTIIRLYNGAGEGGTIFRVRVSDCEVIEGCSELLHFKCGMREFKFTFREWTPGLEKVEFSLLLFGFFPIFEFRGEIGFKYRNELLAVFDKSVNKPLKATPKDDAP